MDTEVIEKSRNQLALISLAMAKISGILGVVLCMLGISVIGWIFMVLAFTLIGICVFLCFKNLKLQKKKENSDIEILKRMKQEGTLKSYLFELERI